MPDPGLRQAARPGGGPLPPSHLVHNLDGKDGDVAKTKPNMTTARRPKGTTDALVKLLAEQLGVDEEDVTPGSHLREDLGADSLDMVEISMAIEEDYHLDEIDLEVVDRWLTVQDVRDWLDRNATAAGR